MDINTITRELIALKSQGESLDIAKAELLATVKTGKLYKADYGTFEKYSDSIGYHRTYCYDLIKVWESPIVRESYGALGALKAVKIAKAGLGDEETTSMVEFAKEHTAADTIARIAEVKNKTAKPKSQADLVQELLNKKEHLETQLAEVLAEIAKLTGEKPKAKGNKTAKANKPAVSTLGDIGAILTPLVVKRATLPILQTVNFIGNKAHATDLESYATLEVEGLDLVACFDADHFKPLAHVPLSARFAKLGKDTLLEVTNGSTQRIPLMPAEEYPYPRTGGEVVAKITLRSEAWESLVKTGNASNAKNADDARTRPVLSTASLYADGHNVSAVSADGFILAENKLSPAYVEGTLPHRLTLIPALALNKIDKAIKRIKAESVTVTIIESHEELGYSKTSTTYDAEFEAVGNGAKLTVRVDLIMGTYPDYNQIVPSNREHGTVATVKRQELESTLKAVVDVNKTLEHRGESHTRFNFNGKITLDAFAHKDEQESHGTWEVGANIKGQELTIAFSASRLLQALSALPEQEFITLHLRKADEPILISAFPGQAVVMPMNLTR